MPVVGRREHLMDVATELFCAHGFHATGIDMILAKAGVSKKTMYAHFRSKEELILACLEQYNSHFRNNFMRQVEKTAPTPYGQLLGVFDVAHAWFSQNNFFGCVFINAVGEYAEADSPVRDISKKFKKLMRSYLLDLSKKANLKNPEAVAAKLALILEGAIVTAQVSGDASSAVLAREMAKNIIDQAKS